MATWTRWVLAHGRIVALVWVLLTVAGGAAASQISDSLSQSFSSPGREGFDTNAEVLKRFGAGGSVPPVVLVADGRPEQARDAFAAIARKVDGSRLVPDAGGEDTAVGL